MKNGTIVLISNTSKKWYHNVVLWFIRNTTGSNKTHIKVWVDGAWYDNGYPKGAGKSSKKYIDCPETVLRELRIDLTTDQVMKMKAFGERSIKEKMKYNIILLLLTRIFFKQRFFWNLIGWVPFSKTKWFGNYCSVYVDRMFKYAGIDCFPGLFEKLTSPGDFEKCDLFKGVS